MMKITDWLERAAEAKWCITALAANCNASISTLERHFLEVMQQCPRDWLKAERQRRARDLLCANTSAKEVSILLGYKNQHHFSFAFSKHHGYPPSLHWERVKTGARKAGNKSQNSGDRGQEPKAESRKPKAG